jgi:predicted lipoprotein with Yx(FWY)xxD motif
MAARRINTFTSLSAEVTVALTAASGAESGTTSSGPATPLGAPTATIAVHTSGGERIVVDAQGRTLYRFKADSGSVRNCDGACAPAPPLRLAHGRPSVGDSLNPSLVTTAQRPRGTRQLTYNGHPPYPFVDDGNPGDVNGAGVTAFGALSYALSPAGNRVAAPASSPGAGTTSRADSASESHMSLHSDQSQGEKK